MELATIEKGLSGTQTNYPLLTINEKNGYLPVTDKSHDTSMDSDIIQTKQSLDSESNHKRIIV